jgi:hypothetical protein
MNTASPIQFYLHATVNKIIYVAIVLVFIGPVAFAQRPLTNSRQSSFYTYIYKISREDVWKMYKDADEAIDEKILVRPFDSARTDKYWENTLPAGNYLKVLAEHNSLKYSLVENHNAFLRLLENSYDKRFVFFDKNGKPVVPETVKFNGHTVRFDTKSETYHLKTSRKTAIIVADRDGLANFFAIKEDGYDEDNDPQGFFPSFWAAITSMFKNLNGYHHNYHPLVVHHAYNGFIAFNKPVYRPDDTVKLKAFLISTKSKTPATVSELLVRLKNDYGEDEKTSTSSILHLHIRATP